MWRGQGRAGPAKSHDMFAVVHVVDIANQQGGSDAKRKVACMGEATISGADTYQVAKNPGVQGSGERMRRMPRVRRGHTHEGHITWRRPWGRQGGVRPCPAQKLALRHGKDVIEHVLEPTTGTVLKEV